MKFTLVMDVWGGPGFDNGTRWGACWLNKGLHKCALGIEEAIANAGL